MLLFLLLLSNALFAQEPASYMLGEDQFKGVKIYDLIQDNAQHFWISTDEGLYEYDYQKYQRVDAKNAKTNALFQFVKNNNGTIYCSNLSNQIFEIKNGECRLFYEVPEKNAGSSITIAITPNNNLAIAANFISIISPKGKRILHKQNLKSNVTSIAGFKNKSIHFTTSDGQVLQFSNFNWKISDFEQTGKNPLLFIELNKKNYLFDAAINKLYPYDLKTGLGESISFEANVPEKFRYYTAANHLWFSGNSKGVYCYSNQNKNLSHYFKDFLVSDVFEDKEGNVLLSTFDHGIIVVPDLKVPGVLPTFEEGEILALYNDDELGFVCGTDQGAIFTHKNNVFKSILAAPKIKAPIEGIYGNDRFPFMIVGNGTVVAIHRKTGKLSSIMPGSLKDVVFTGDNSFFVATNKGLYYLEWKGGEVFVSKQIRELNFRIYALAYDKQNDAIYASTAKGLMYLQAGKVKPLTYQNQELYVSDFFEKDGIVWASTQNFGILKFSGTQIVGVTQPKVDGNLESVNKFAVDENYILAATSSGFYKFSTSGSVIDALHISNSFGSRRVYDFIATETEVWVSHFGGVQHLNLNYRLNIPTSSYLQFSEVIANNKVVDNQHEFTHKENRISFVLTAPTLRNRRIDFTYQLAGFDDFWIHADNQTNSITYNALPPGDYVFLVKQEDARGTSRVLKYPIHISPPFYFRWWFISLLILVICLFGFYFLKRIRFNEKTKLNGVHTFQDLQLEILKTLQSIESPIALPLDAISEKWFTKNDLETLLQRNFGTQLKNDTLLEIDWKLTDETKLPVWIIIPFVYHAFSFGFNGKVGQKSIRLAFSENDEIVLCTIEDNVPRFSDNRSRRLETDKTLAESQLMKELFFVITSKNSTIRVSHNEKISGEQMLGTTLAISIPKG